MQPQGGDRITLRHLLPAGTEQQPAVPREQRVVLLPQPMPRVWC